MPVRSALTVADQWSSPALSSVIGTVVSAPSGSVRTTVALTASWPSRNTVAVTSNSSSTTDLAGQAPPSTSGATFSTGMRPRGRWAAGVRGLAVTRTTLPGPGALASPGRPGLSNLQDHENSARKRQSRAAVCPLCFGPVKAIRRFSVRTVLPEPIAALGDLASNLRWSWHPPTRDLFSADRPQALGQGPQGPRPAALGPVRRRARRPGRRRGVRRAGARGRRGPADLPAPSRAGTRAGPPTGRGRRPGLDRLLQPRVRHHRGAAAVLRRPRHPRRRPPQVRLRPRRARSSASACSTRPATSSSR